MRGSLFFHAQLPTAKFLGTQRATLPLLRRLQLRVIGRGDTEEFVGRDDLPPVLRADYMVRALTLLHVLSVPDRILLRCLYTCRRCARPGDKTLAGFANRHRVHDLTRL